MPFSRSHEKPSVKLTAFLTALFLCISQCILPVPAWAGPAFLSEIVAQLIAPLRVDLPPDLGTIDHLHSGSGPMLFHIQEAHGNAEGQRKIRDILHYLKEHYGADLLLLEGAAFPLDPELIRLFPKDMGLTMEILEDLASKSYVTAPELFLADECKGRTPCAPTVSAYGVEDLKKYVENARAFVNVLRQKEKTGQFLAQLDLQIERLTSPYLNKDLRNFLKRVYGSNAGAGLPRPVAKALGVETAPLQILPYLKKEGAERLGIEWSHPVFQIDWPMLMRLFTLQEMEKKIDLRKFEEEREEFLKIVRPFIVGARFPRPLLSEGGETPPLQLFDEIARLLSLHLSYHSLPDPDTGVLFEQMAAALPKDFPYSKYPNVNLFIGHLILQSELKADLLAKEMERLTDRLLEQLIRNEKEKEIVALLKDYRLLTKLFALELTPEDWDKIVGADPRVRPMLGDANGPTHGSAPTARALRPSTLLHRLLALNADRRVRNIDFLGSDPNIGVRPQYDDLDRLFNLALEFYRGARERDEAMLRNIEAMLKKTGKTKAVVITGGFHAGPFRDYFSKHGYSYALITPKLTSAGGHETYVKRFLENRSSPLRSQGFATAEQGASGVRTSTIAETQLLGQSPVLLADREDGFGINPGPFAKELIASFHRAAARRGLDPAAINRLLTEQPPRYLALLSRSKVRRNAGERVEIRGERGKRGRIQDGREFRFRTMWSAMRRPAEISSTIPNPASIIGSINLVSFFRLKDHREREANNKHAQRYDPYPDISLSKKVGQKPGPEYDLGEIGQHPRDSFSFLGTENTFHTVPFLLSSVKGHFMQLFHISQSKFSLLLNISTSPFLLFGRSLAPVSHSEARRGLDPNRLLREQTPRYLALLSPPGPSARRAGGRSKVRRNAGERVEVRGETGRIGDRAGGRSEARQEIMATKIRVNKTELELVPLTKDLLLEEADEVFRLLNQIAANVHWNKDKHLLGPIDDLHYFDPALSFAVRDPQGKFVAFALNGRTPVEDEVEDPLSRERIDFVKKQGWNPGSAAVYINFMGVDEGRDAGQLINYQGKGVAQWLVYHVVEAAKKQGISWSYLRTRTDTEQSLRFYRKSGFVEFKETPPEAGADIEGIGHTELVGRFEDVAPKLVDEFNRKINRSEARKEPLKVSPEVVDRLIAAFHPDNLIAAYQGWDTDAAAIKKGEPSFKVLHVASRTLRDYANPLDKGLSGIADLQTQMETLIHDPDDKGESIEQFLAKVAGVKDVDVSLVQLHGAGQEKRIAHGNFSGNLRVVLVHRPEEVWIRLQKGEIDRKILEDADAIVMLGDTYLKEYREYFPGKPMVPIPHGFYNPGALDEGQLEPDAVNTVGTITSFGEMRGLEDAVRFIRRVKKSAGEKEKQILGYLGGSIDRKIENVDRFSSQPDTKFLDDAALQRAKSEGAFKDLATFREWVHKFAEGKIVIRTDKTQDKEVAVWEESLIDFNLQFYRESAPLDLGALGNGAWAKILLDGNIKVEYSATAHKLGSRINVVADSRSMRDIHEKEKFWMVLTPVGQDNVTIEYEKGARQVLGLIRNSKGRRRIIEKNIQRARELNMNTIAFAYDRLFRILHLIKDGQLPSEDFNLTNFSQSLQSSPATKDSAGQRSEARLVNIPLMDYAKRKILGWLSYPQDFAIDEAVKYLDRNPNQDRRPYLWTYLKLREKMKRNPLISGYLRGLDFAGSSLDLFVFRVLLTFSKVTSFLGLPQTPVIASSFELEMEIQPASRPDVNEYVDETGLYLPKDEVVTTQGLEDERFNVNPKDDKPHMNQKYAPGYIAALFGVTGVRFVLKKAPRFGKFGGLGTSGAFNGFVAAALASVTGSKMTIPDVIGEATRIEVAYGTDPRRKGFAGNTGGQELISTFFGKAFIHFWLRGVHFVKDVFKRGVYQAPAEKDLVHPFQASFTVPFIEDDPEVYKEYEGRMLVVQPGIWMLPGLKPADPRSAALINDRWTEQLMFSLIGSQMNARKLRLPPQYVSGMAKKNFEEAIYAFTEQFNIRDALLRDWFNLALDWIEAEEAANDSKLDEMRAKTPWAEEYARKLRTQDDLKMYYEKYKKGDINLREDSLYSYTTKILFGIAQKVTEELGEKHKIGLFNLGAGGPGTMVGVLATTPEALQLFIQLLEGTGIKRMTEETLEQFEKKLEAANADNPNKNTPLEIKGWTEFKIGKEPVRFVNFEESELAAVALKELKPEEFGENQKKIESDLQKVSVNGAVDLRFSIPKGPVTVYRYDDDTYEAVSEEDRPLIERVNLRSLSARVKPAPELVSLDALGRIGLRPDVAAHLGRNIVRQARDAGMELDPQEVNLRHILLHLDDIHLWFNRPEDRRHIREILGKIGVKAAAKSEARFADPSQVKVGDVAEYLRRRFVSHQNIIEALYVGGKDETTLADVISALNQWKGFQDALPNAPHRREVLLRGLIALELLAEGTVPVKVDGILASLKRESFDGLVESEDIWKMLKEAEVSTLAEVLDWVNNGAFISMTKYRPVFKWKLLRILVSLGLESRLKAEVLRVGAQLAPSSKVLLSSEEVSKLLGFFRVGTITLAGVDYFTVPGGDEAFATARGLIEAGVSPVKLLRTLEALRPGTMEKSTPQSIGIPSATLRGIEKHFYPSEKTVFTLKDLVQELNNFRLEKGERDNRLTLTQVIDLQEKGELDAILDEIITAPKPERPAQYQLRSEVRKLKPIGGVTPDEKQLYIGIGLGPANIRAAEELLATGRARVIIFDRYAFPGGKATVGIPLDTPEQRLLKWNFLQRPQGGPLGVSRIEALMRHPDFLFLSETDIGKDPSEGGVPWSRIEAAQVPLLYGIGAQEFNEALPSYKGIKGVYNLTDFIFYGRNVNDLVRRKGKVLQGSEDGVKSLKGMGYDFLPPAPEPELGEVLAIAGGGNVSGDGVEYLIYLLDRLAKRPHPLKKLVFIYRGPVELMASLDPPYHEFIQKNNTYYDALQKDFLAWRTSQKLDDSWENYGRFLGEAARSDFQNVLSGRGQNDYENWLLAEKRRLQLSAEDKLQDTPELFRRFIRKAGRLHRVKIKVVGLRTVERYETDTNGRINKIILRKHQVSGFKLDGQGKPVARRTSATGKVFELIEKGPKGRRKVPIREILERLHRDGDSQIADVPPGLKVEDGVGYALDTVEVEGKEGEEPLEVDTLLDGMGHHREPMPGLILPKNISGRIRLDSGVPMDVLGQAATNNGALGPTGRSVTEAQLAKFNRTFFDEGDPNYQARVAGENADSIAEGFVRMRFDHHLDAFQKLAVRLEAINRLVAGLRQALGDTEEAELLAGLRKDFVQKGEVVSLDEFQELVEQVRLVLKRSPNPDQEFERMARQRVEAFFVDRYELVGWGHALRTNGLDVEFAARLTASKNSGALYNQGVDALLAHMNAPREQAKQILRRALPKVEEDHRQKTLSLFSDFLEVTGPEQAQPAIEQITQNSKAHNFLVQILEERLEGLNQVPVRDLPRDPAAWKAYIQGEGKQALSPELAEALSSRYIRTSFYADDIPGLVKRALTDYQAHKELDGRGIEIAAYLAGPEGRETVSAPEAFVKEHWSEYYALMLQLVRTAKSLNPQPYHLPLFQNLVDAFNHLPRPNDATLLQYRERQEIIVRAAHHQARMFITAGEDWTKQTLLIPQGGKILLKEEEHPAELILHIDPEHPDDVSFGLIPVAPAGGVLVGGQKANLRQGEDFLFQDEAGNLVQVVLEQAGDKKVRVRLRKPKTLSAKKMEWPAPSRTSDQQVFDLATGPLSQDVILLGKDEGEIRITAKPSEEDPHHEVVFTFRSDEDNAVRILEGKKPVLKKGEGFRFEDAAGNKVYIFLSELGHKNKTAQVHIEHPRNLPVRKVEAASLDTPPPQRPISLRDSQSFTFALDKPGIKKIRLGNGPATMKIALTPMDKGRVSFQVGSQPGNPVRILGGAGLWHLTQNSAVTLEVDGQKFGLRIEERGQHKDGAVWVAFDKPAKARVKIEEPGAAGAKSEARAIRPGKADLGSSGTFKVFLARLDAKMPGHWKWISSFAGRVTKKWNKGQEATETAKLRGALNQTTKFRPGETGDAHAAVLGELQRLASDRVWGPRLFDLVKPKKAPASRGTNLLLDAITPLANSNAVLAAGLAEVSASRSPARRNPTGRSEARIEPNVQKLNEWDIWDLWNLVVAASQREEIGTAGTEFNVTSNEHPFKVRINSQGRTIILSATVGNQPWEKTFQAGPSFNLDNLIKILRAKPKRTQSLPAKSEARQVVEDPAGLVSKALGWLRRPESPITDAGKNGSFHYLYAETALLNVARGLELNGKVTRLEMSSLMGQANSLIREKSIPEQDKNEALSVVRQALEEAEKSRSEARDSRRASRVGANPRVRPQIDGQTHGSAPTEIPKDEILLAQVEEALTPGVETVAKEQTNRLVPRQVEQEHGPVVYQGVVLQVAGLLEAADADSKAVSKEDLLGRVLSLAEVWRPGQRNVLDVGARHAVPPTVIFTEQTQRKILQRAGVRSDQIQDAVLLGPEFAEHMLGLRIGHALVNKLPKVILVETQAQMRRVRAFNRSLERRGLGHLAIRPVRSVEDALAELQKILAGFSQSDSVKPQVFLIRSLSGASEKLRQALLLEEQLFDVYWLNPDQVAGMARDLNARDAQIHGYLSRLTSDRFIRHSA